MAIAFEKLEGQFVYFISHHIFCLNYFIYQDAHWHGNKRCQSTMPEANPDHFNGSILFNEEGPVAGPQDIRSNKGSAPGKIYRINPLSKTSEIEDHFNPATWDDKFSFLKELTV